MVSPALLGELDGAALADHRDLDLPRVLELPLDLAGDLVREEHRPVVVDLPGLDEDPDLSAGLDRVDLLDTRLLGGDLLERLQPADVVLERLAARARA